MLKFWILPEGRTEPLVAAGVLAWGRWMETADRSLARTPTRSGGMVSTVFLGLDHNWTDIGPPILWETMVFSGPLNGYQERYRTYEEARLGHDEAVRLVYRYETERWWHLVRWLAQEHYRMWRAALRKELP